MTKAVRYARHGGPEVLELVEVRTPEPGNGQVRVAVHASGVNAIDWKIRSGAFAEEALAEEALAEPAGTGSEFAGVVDAVGPDAGDWAVGQAVFGLAPGSAATHVLAGSADLVAKPDWLSFIDAAALPMAAETAYRTLRLLGVRAGQTLLIHAVAGGVGLIAAQLARAWGANVVGTAGEGHHDFLRELGVVPVTYEPGIEARVRAVAPDGVDAVLDGSGRGVLGLSVALTGSPEKVITIADGDAAAHGVHFSSWGEVEALSTVFGEVLPRMERGELRLPIDRTFPLERVADAQRASEEGHLRGKLVVTVT
ncbi:NADPH:quinone reductase [Amycolatopsis antarctica]|uniref:NADPH:quinone reductase n=1 Tax=Amycolatopsis antarctica TaxID=1854586 RepID=A0A263D735_9PSEU|nr:NADP-dependent oxidoreductase [Amycolatopsis antarctica]OZM73296.1 NADPH:quinone reductase [Amycolatopsis antarctica]